MFIPGDNVSIRVGQECMVRIVLTTFFIAARAGSIRLIPAPSIQIIRTAKQTTVTPPATNNPCNRAVGDQKKTCKANGGHDKHYRGHPPDRHLRVDLALAIFRTMHFYVSRDPQLDMKQNQLILDEHVQN